METYQEAISKVIAKCYRINPFSSPNEFKKTLEEKLKSGLPFVTKVLNWDVKNTNLTILYQDNESGNSGSLDFNLTPIGPVY
jgi:hypothetical protein